MDSGDTPVLTETADVFIQRAVERRPDLLAQATKLHAADAAIRSARAQYLPKVTLSGSAQEQHHNRTQPPLPSVSGIAPAWLFKLGANWTVFDGRARYYDLDRARSERRQGIRTGRRGGSSGR